MVRTLPELSFCGGLIVSQPPHGETRSVISLHLLNISKYLTDEAVDLTESDLFPQTSAVNNATALCVHSVHSVLLNGFCCTLRYSQSACYPFHSF